MRMLKFGTRYSTNHMLLSEDWFKVRRHNAVEMSLLSRDVVHVLISDIECAVNEMLKS